MRRIFSLLVAVCLVAGGLLAGPTTAQAAPPAARLLPMKAKVPAATVKPAAIPGKKVATKKSTATLKPRYTKTSTAKVVSARITVKKGGKTVARNKASYKAKPGTYTVTQVVKYRKAAKTKVDKKTGKVTVTAWAKKQYTVTKTNKVKVTVSPPKKLANTTKPSIKGTAQPGNLLTADRGKWSGSGIGYTYEWLRDGTPIPNSAYRPTYYRPTFADLGRKISVRVTATTKKDVRSATSKAVTVAPPKKKVQACGASTYADFAAGGDFGLVLSAAGEVCGWGENALGQLGTTTADYQAKPVKVQVPKAKAVAAGNGHGLALTTAGDVWAWGHNESGQLGIDDPKKLVPSDCAECHQVGVPLLFAPRKVAGLPKIASIVAVGDTSVAVAADGSVYVWGDSRIFPAPVTYPRKLSGISGAAKVVTDGERYLALTRSGTMLQWGLWVVGYRQPDGSVSTSSAQGGELVYQKAPATAKKVSVEGKVVDVAMPDYAAYALTDTGKVYAWGTGGGLGRLLPVLTWPDSRVVAKPTLWKKLPAAKAIFAGGDSAIAELKDGRVVLWGEPGDWDGHDHRKYASCTAGRLRGLCHHIPPPHAVGRRLRRRLARRADHDRLLHRPVRLRLRRLPAPDVRASAGQRRLQETLHRRGGEEGVLQLLLRRYPGGHPRGADGPSGLRPPMDGAVHVPVAEPAGMGCHALHGRSGHRLQRHLHRQGDGEDHDGMDMEARRQVMDQDRDQEMEVAG